MHTKTARSVGGEAAIVDPVGVTGSGCVSGGIGQSRLTRSRANRRNTMDCAILNEMFIEDDARKEDKRSKQLIREYERDQKRQSMILNYPVPTLASGNAVQTTTNEKVRLNNPSINEEHTENMTTNRSSNINTTPKLVS